MPIVLDVTGASIMDACFINESGYTTNALDQWAELCHSLGYDISPLSRAVGGSTVRSANGALTQIAAVDARYTGATVEVLAVAHCWGNQNSLNGAYPADWDATEIANFREDVVNVVTALNATPIDDAIYCNMTYRVGVGTGVNTDIIEDEFANEGETSFVDLYTPTLAAANAGNYFVSGDPIHPTSTGVPAIHTPILDYIAANHSALSILKTYEDKAVINFGGDAVRYIGNLNQIDATGSHGLIGQSGNSMGTLVLTGGTGFAGTGFTSSSPINKNALYWNAEYWAIDDGTFFGQNAGYTVQYSDATRPNREVIITIFCSRNASGREFDLTFDGVTTRIDPQGITGPRTVSKQVTLDGSGNAPLITGTVVGTYLYLTGMDVQLVPEPTTSSLSQSLSIGLSIGL
jgi:hypothetical protein